MLTSLCFQLKAINEERNIFRQYEIYVGKDLLGSWLLTIAYGRIGQVTQIKNYPFETLENLQEKLQELLKKRLSSRRRIGANYTIRYRARIRVKNYHKELKKPWNPLFSAAYRGMSAFL